MYGLTCAPELGRNGMHWFNTDYTLTLTSLRGRMVILDFWTSCCINCLHVQSTLKHIEETFPNEVIIIGVHSPKFPAEHNPENVQYAIDRCDILHPVIHDPTMHLWQEYAVHAWPTLVIIGPDGMVVGNISGEPDGDLMIQGIAEMLKGWKREKLLRPAPLPQYRKKTVNGKALRFPGKIKSLQCDGPDRWVLADSGHHQIVLLDKQGRETRRFGTGKAGFMDGIANTSQFNAPQGLVATNNTNGLNY